ncbi:MAG TPA: zinc ribbon domain-containing protein [Blastocatellia bacterium]|nr:zinc ribbon domain-containing protein [Blastocatellia bacterium]
MFCPGCGYQITAGHVRYCPGCGFRLDGVTDLLARNGEPGSQGPQAQPQALANLSERQKGVRLGVKLILLSVVLFPIFLALSVLFDSPGPLLPPATIFLAGIAWSLYSAIFGEEGLPARPVKTPPRPRDLIMPVRQSVTAPTVGPHGPQTREPVHPPSVTEHTTNLLKDE